MDGASPAVLDYRELWVRGEDRFQSRPVHATDGVKVMYLYFEPGQFIPAHTPGVDLTLHVLEGEATVVVDGAERRVGPGQAVFVPRGHQRGVRAESRMAALAVVSPNPTEVDHDGVREGLAEGRFRKEA